MVELYDPNSGLLDLIERCRYLTKQKQKFFNDLLNNLSKCFIRKHC
jgi:hypothetical protein